MAADLESKYPETQPNSLAMDVYLLYYAPHVINYNIIEKRDQRLQNHPDSTFQSSCQNYSIWIPHENHEVHCRYVLDGRKRNCWQDFNLNVYHY